ncbi:MAG: hypothetical protein MJ229_05720 [bacterium]|nr:hypothetical protein [bacterium]
MRELLVSKKYLIFPLLIFVLVVFARGFYVKQRQGIHIDELFTSAISNCSDYGWINTESGLIFGSGDYIKNLFIDKNSSSISDLKQDLKVLHKNNNGDLAHPNMYYVGYRLISYFSDCMDLKNIIKTGFILNLFIFIFEFFFMYKLLQLLFEDKSIVNLGLISAFLTTASVSIGIFVRPYELQTFAVIFLAYYFVFYLKKTYAKENIFTVKNIVELSFVFAISFLSGYFVAIYLAALGCVLLFFTIQKKVYKNIMAYLVAILVSLILVLVFYNGYFNFVTSEERLSEIDNLFVGKMLLLNIYGSLRGGILTLLNYVFYVPIVIALFYCNKFFDVDKKLLSSEYLIIPITFFVMCIILIMSPYKILRYISPFLPILSIFIPYSVSKIYDKKRYFVMSFVIVILLMNLFCAKSIESYETQIKCLEKDRFPFVAHIENLYLQFTSKNEFAKHPEIPMVIYSPMIEGINIVFYLNDKQHYDILYLNEDYSIIKSLMFKYEHSYLGIPNNIFIKLPKKENVLNSYSYQHLHIVELKF